MKPHEEWLYKAEHDLESAKVLLEERNHLYDISIYHAHQCAEKALKAYLAFNEKEIAKTHNLKVLSENCMEIEPDFNKIIDDSIFLNPYATLFRYPEGELMPDRETLLKAISTAERILDFVKSTFNAGT